MNLVLCKSSMIISLLTILLMLGSLLLPQKIREQALSWIKSFFNIRRKKYGK